MLFPISPESQEMPVGRTVLKVTPEKQPGPTPVRKYNANANIITTEDNKIHIHLGSQFKRGPGTSAEGASPVITVRPVNVTAEKEVSTGTVLRSPRNHLSPRPGASKVTSTITITPVTTSSARGTQSVVSRGGFLVQVNAGVRQGSEDRITQCPKGNQSTCLSSAEPTTGCFPRDCLHQEMRIKRNLLFYSFELIVRDNFFFSLKSCGLQNPLAKMASCHLSLC